MPPTTMAPPGMMDLTPRESYLPPPGSGFITDVAGETPMRQLAMQSVARERDAMYRQRLMAAGPPTPNSLPPSGTPAGAPSPASMPPTQNEPVAMGGYGNMPANAPADATAYTPGVSAGPRLLSPPEWAAKFMPNLAGKPYASKRELRLLDQGYQQYVKTVQNEQQQAHYAQQESRFDRQFQLTREDRNADNARADRAEVETKRYRDASLNQKQALNPEEEAFKQAFDQAYAKSGDPLDALAKASLARKGGAGAGSDNPMNALTAEAIAEQKGQGKSPTDIMATLADAKRTPEKDASLLDKGEFNKRMGGSVLGEGLANAPEWQTDAVGQFKKYASYIQSQMATASPAERKLLRQAIKGRAPYKTPDEVRAAYAAGKFDPPALSSWKKTGREFLLGEESPDHKAQRVKQAQQAANEYLGLLMDPEELDAQRGRGGG